MRWRLVGAFVGVMVVVLLALGIPLAGHLRDVEGERLTAELQRDAFNIGSIAVDPLLAANADDLSNLQSSLDVYVSGDDAGVAVTDARGVVVAAAGDTTQVGDDLSKRAEVASALAGAPAAGRASDVYVAVPVRAGARTIGSVRVTFPADVIDTRANSKLRGLLAVGLISLAAAVIAALFMAGTVVGPLRRLQRTTEIVAAGDFGARADIGEGAPEVRSLATSFDAMTARVARLVEQQRSFASDASHQLRTPLTALRLQLDRAAEIATTDPDGARERIEAASVETERLQRLVEGLLLLARSDQRVAATVDVDVAAVACERGDIWRPLAAERGVDVHTRVDGVAHARAVMGAVEQIIDNFLDNAISIVADDTTVDVVVVPLAGWVEVHILDRGPGMTDEQLTHAFDRFWRAPDAPHGGSGLGLAIVDHLAAASGGSVSLANRAGGGLDACLRLPAQSSAACD